MDPGSKGVARKARASSGGDAGITNTLNVAEPLEPLEAPQRSALRRNIILRA